MKLNELPDRMSGPPALVVGEKHLNLERLEFNASEVWSTQISDIQRFKQEGVLRDLV